MSCIVFAIRRCCVKVFLSVHSRILLEPVTPVRVFSRSRQAKAGSWVTQLRAGLSMGEAVGINKTNQNQNRTKQNTINIQITITIT